MEERSYAGLIVGGIFSGLFALGSSIIVCRRDHVACCHYTGHTLHLPYNEVYPDAEAVMFDL